MGANQGAAASSSRGDIPATPEVAAVPADSVVGRLAELGVQLPSPPVAQGSYEPVVQVGNLVFVAGQLPFVSGELLATGLVASEPSGSAQADQHPKSDQLDPGDLDLAIARECARQCTINALAAVTSIAELESIARVVKVTGYVAAGQGFSAHAKVIDAASEFLVAVFGDRGRHARVAVGAPHLPLNSPVELELILELEHLS